MCNILDTNEKLEGFLPFSWDLTKPEDSQKIIDYFGSNKGLKINAKVKKVMLDELKKIVNSKKQNPFMSQSDNSSLSYLEVLLKMPWGVTSEDNTSLSNARKVLDEDHSSLVKVKKRVIEFLAIRALNQKSSGSI